MNKKTIAIIIIIVSVLLVILFIFLRAKTDIEAPNNSPAEENETEYHLKVEINTVSYTVPTAENELPTVPPTVNGKPVLSPSEAVKESESVYVNPIINEAIDISINGVLVDNMSILKDLYDTGYRLDKNSEKKTLKFNEINNPYLSKSNDKNDQIMVVIQNTDSISSQYSDCKIKNIMCDFLKCKADIYVGKHQIQSLSPENLVEYFGSPQSFLEENSLTYISYQAKNLQFDFEFEDEKIISLGIALT